MENENVIEFLNGQEYASVTFNSRRHITKLKKLHEKDSSSFVAYVENEDGSVWAKIPLSWIKVSIPRQMSEESKRAAGERLRGIRCRNME